MPAGRQESSREALEFHWATADRWRDLESLFGERGACGGCWCMAWRRRPKEFREGKGEGNRQALREIVVKGRKPGVLAYLDGEPVAWCAVAPRSDYSFLARSRVLRPVDERPVWSVSCLFVTRAHRRCGISARLIAAAAELAAEEGARIVEGYPVEPRAGKLPDPFVWTGTLSAFARAGFSEVARRSPTRPLMRRSFGRKGCGPMEEAGP